MVYVNVKRNHREVSLNQAQASPAFLSSFFLVVLLVSVLVYVNVCMYVCMYAISMFVCVASTGVCVECVGKRLPSPLI